MTSNVDRRPNRVAKGFTKNHERQIASHGDRFRWRLDRSVVDKLMLYGTTDRLAERGGSINRISRTETKSHPTDSGYTKKVYVLSKYGRRLLDKHRKKTNSPTKQPSQW